MKRKERTADKPYRGAISRLKLERERRGWSQGELGERIATNQVTVSRWENGTSTPSPYFRQRLAEVFGKSVEELGLLEGATKSDGTAQPGAIPDSLPSSAIHLPSIWNVPYRRNAYFTGREDVLAQVHTALGESKAAALTQAQAISGLGGIGKTQVAVEYAYRYGSQYTAVLWVTASSRETLIAEFVMLAALLDLPEKNEQDQNIVLSAVIRWLSTNSGWLLILDNVDDLRTIEDVLPKYSTGSILLTTRLQALGSLAQGITVDKMEKDEGILFLLRRTKLLTAHAPLTQARPQYLDKAAEIVAELDALPLALDQAGAYIEETHCGLLGYLTLYHTRQKELLLRRGNLPADHPEPVATTWSLSFQQVEQQDSAAADLLRLLAFLSPESIPEELLANGAAELGPELGPAANDPLRINDIIELLLRYSLIRRNTEEQSLSIHRLVQAVLKDGMSKQLMRSWAERAIRALNRTFPEVRFSSWERCRRCLPHVLTGSIYLEEYHLAFPAAADLLNKAAAYLTAHAQYAQAEPLLKKALAIRQQALDAANHDSALALNDLGALYLTLGKYQEAEPLLQEALEIRQRQLGSEHPDTATSLNNVAQLYHAQGKYDEAEKFYLQSLKIREKVLAADHPDRASSLDHLAELYTDQGKYAQAEEIYLQALDMQKRVLGSENPDVAHTINNLALVYRKKGDYIQAERLYREALSTQQLTLGLEHPAVAETLNNLARLFRAQGDYVQAEPRYLEALAIREHAFGPDHPLVAMSCFNLAKLYRSQGRYLQAEELCKRALLIQERTLGEHHPDIAYTLDTLAKLYLTKQRYVESEQLYQRALDIRIAALGQNHPNVALILSSLGEVYLAQEKFLQARPLIEQSLEIRERTLGKEHPYIAYNLMNLAETYLLEGNVTKTEQLCMQAYAEAIQLYKRAQAIREKSLGPEHPHTATIHHKLAALYYAQGRYDLAEPLFRTALAIREKALAPEHPDLVDTLESLSRILANTGRETLAAEFEARAQAIKSRRKRKSLELEK